mmetsp:Transcript_109220/g.308977  ORF Transcript_109220/g.308977 Transcript_109220/m.308977 type:complete len:226 (+) Transcript_109220:1484-2161(+)
MQRGRGANRRLRRAHPPRRLPAPARRGRVAGADTFRHDDPREHPVRGPRPRGVRGADGPHGGARELPRLHREVPGEVRSDRRGARGAAERRAEAARGHRAGTDGQAAGHPAGRGHVGAGRRVRARRARAPREARRADLRRGRAPPLHDTESGAHHRPGGRRRRRDGLPQGAAGEGRRLQGARAAAAGRPGGELAPGPTRRAPAPPGSGRSGWACAGGSPSQPRPQ